MDKNGYSKERWTQNALQREIGGGIVRLRRRRGWSQAVLAQRLNVKRHRLGKWEQGINPPSLEALVALLGVLEVSFEELALGCTAPTKRLPAGQRKELMMCLRGLLRRLEPLVGDPNCEREAR
ncbi:MAG TPA: helix-turn-helix transcriptional regulator [Thermoanaerobaculia bacterium]|jgi:transcriptional regulator with XRE-family HTH domain|nr:helix-turn-helix transcriptional regulator [Thermoanaerobaculia bacterium]